MSFNLENYETVKERKKKFYTDYEDGRIIVELLNLGTVNEFAVFKATIYKNRDDQQNNLPFATGNAHEQRDTEKKMSNAGKEYETVNYSAWVENCEESAIGRALDNAGYAGNNKCSREEMKKVERRSEKKTHYTKLDFNEIVADISNQWSIEDLEKLLENILEDFPNTSDKQNAALQKIFSSRIEEIKNESL